MMKRAFTVLAVLMFGVIFAQTGRRLQRTPDPVSALAEHYLTQVPQELGAPNVVTGILITFRGFDTLGEVAVLFMVAASVGILLANKPSGAEAARRQRSQRRPQRTGGKWRRGDLAADLPVRRLCDHERPSFGRRRLSGRRGRRIGRHAAGAGHARHRSCITAS